MNDVTLNGPVAEPVLIPGGAFLMGADSEGDHSPIHQVRLGSFHMDRY